MNKKGLKAKFGLVSFCLGLFLAATLPSYAGEAMDKFEIGNELLSKGSAKSAIFFYDKCIKLNPSFYPAYIKRGDALRKLGKYKWAKEDYRQAMKLNPACLEAKRKLYGTSSGKKRKKRRRKAKGPDRKGMSAKAKKGLSGSSGGLSSGSSFKPPTSD